MGTLLSLLVIDRCHRMLFLLNVKLFSLCYDMFDEESVRFTLFKDHYKFFL